MKIHLADKQSVHWFLDLNTVDNGKLPFTIIIPGKISCEFEGMKYSITTPVGSFLKPENGTIFRISPKLNALNLYFATGN
jgi:hypothetical protein